MGDTVIEAPRPVTALPGLTPSKTVVFAGLLPVLAGEYEPFCAIAASWKTAGRNDAAFFYERKIP